MAKRICVRAGMGASLTALKSPCQTVSCDIAYFSQPDGLFLRPVVDRRRTPSQGGRGPVQRGAGSPSAEVTSLRHEGVPDPAFAARRAVVTSRLATVHAPHLLA